MYTYSKTAMFKKDESVVLRIVYPYDCCENDHIHEFIELVYTISGTAQHKIDDKVYEAMKKKWEDEMNGDGKGTYTELAFSQGSKKE